MTELDMNRSLRYASHSYQSLQTNSQHQFAAHHALQLYRSGAVYSFIPKNACSTLRLTLALENGCIKDTADYNWIHLNNDAFVANLPALINAPYTFVVLRCPFARVASTFLDKIVGHSIDAWQIYDAIRRTQQISTFTFDFFVRKLATAAIRNSNIHWRSQMDFLVYEEYDDYFCLEEFSHAVKTLQQKIGLAVVDARKLTSHGIDSFEIIQGEESFTHTSVLEIMNLKAAGKCPSPRALFSPELVAIVRSLFQKDIDFYAQHFGEDNLLFPAQAGSARGSVLPVLPALPVVPEASAKPWINSACCNICGGQFNHAKPDLAGSTDTPSCGSCGALVAERVVRHLLQALPCGFLSWRRGLQIGKNRGISQVDLRSLQIVPADPPLVHELVSQAAESFDFIAVCADWQPDFAQLSRLLSADGLMLVDAGALASLATFHDAQADWAEQNLSSMTLQEIDPCTGREMTLHLFGKSLESVNKVKNWQSGWKPG